MFSVALLLLSSCKEEDQEMLTPEITSFTPGTGLPGITEVTIAGKNFSSRPENNTVKVGPALSTVTSATTTSITIIVPSNAVTGKISVETNGITATSQDDFIVEVSPADFFTLTVDPLLATSSSDHWVMASSSEGKWIDVQPFEAGDIIKLNGIVPNRGTFTLHLFSMSKFSNGLNHCNIRSFGEIPVNSTWHVNDIPTTNTSVGELALQVNNYPVSSDRPSPPNRMVNVSSNVGVLDYMETTSGDAVNMNVRVRGNPADILITVYKDGFPHYVEYQNITIPSAISVDALTHVKIADRTFTMKLPTGNNDARAGIQAYRAAGKYGYTMSEFIDLNGASTIRMGYNFGYERYRTWVSCSYGIAGMDGRRQSNYGRLSNTVEENPVLPPFNFSVTKRAADDFVSLSDLAFDVSGITFTHNTPDFSLFWYIVQPNRNASLTVNFKLDGFPSSLVEKYPFLPALNEVTYHSVSGFQDMGSDSYERMLTTQAETGWGLMKVSADNYYHFIKYAH